MHTHTRKHPHTTPPLHHIIKPISKLNGEAINTSRGSRQARPVRRLVTLVLMALRADAPSAVTVTVTVLDEPPIVLIVNVS